MNKVKHNKDIITQAVCTVRIAYFRIFQLAYEHDKTMTEHKLSLVYRAYCYGKDPPQIVVDKAQELLNDYYEKYGEFDE